MNLKEILDNARAGGGLTYAQVLALLALDPDSADAQALCIAAHEASLFWSRGWGYIWASIGIDSVPCPVNCSFCSLGERWGIVKERRTLQANEVLKRIRFCDVPEVRWIVLRTTAFYSVDALVCIARLAMPLNYAELVVNTGEISEETARVLHDAGFRRAYHTMRLREGKDTGVDITERLETLRAIRNSPLELSSLIEPIGPEHTNEEIAGSLFLHKTLGATIMGAMARFAVPGTPKYGFGAITQSRLAQITAVTRLAVGKQACGVCTHPTDERIVRSGANTVVLEYGAIPRDTEISESEWLGFTVQNASKLLRDAGYKMMRCDPG